MEHRSESSEELLRLYVNVVTNRANPLSPLDKVRSYNYGSNYYNKQL